MSSPYERQRLANIERNHAELKRLGLLSTSPAVGASAPLLSSLDHAPRTAARKRKRGSTASRDRSPHESRRAQTSARRSLRLAVALTPTGPAAAQNATTVHKPEQAHHGSAEWVQALFNAPAARKLTKVLRPSDVDVATAQWDPRRAHQHLTISQCGCVVATTGCAGYGAALAKPPTAANQTTALRWDVEVMQLGTGGFAVGVARANMPSPFKSLGNNQAWVVHCDGRMMHNRATLFHGEAGGSTFGVGDVISVCLAPCENNSERPSPAGDRWLSFEKNGVPIGTRWQLPAKTAFALAVQPYMGGAARLLPQ